MSILTRVYVHFNPHTRVCSCQSSHACMFISILTHVYVHVKPHTRVCSCQSSHTCMFMSILTHVYVHVKPHKLVCSFRPLKVKVRRQSCTFTGHKHKREWKYTTLLSKWSKFSALRHSHFTPGVRVPWCPLKRRLFGSQIQPGRHAGSEDFFYTPEI